MPIYTFVCDCGKKSDVLFKRIDTETKEYKCACGNTAKRIIGGMPGVKYIGTGFACVDAEQEKRYKEAVDIADNVYTKRAEQAPNLAKDDAFWQDLAKTVGD